MYPNSQTSTYTYFGNTDDRRLQAIHHQTGGGTTLSRFTYGYDKPGNIKTWTQQYGTDVTAYDFTYDAADQLTGAVYRTTDPTPAVLKRYGYAYDAAGNRTTARVDDAPTTFTYNTLNQLTSQVSGGTVAFSGTTSEPATVTIGGTPATTVGSSAFRGSVALPAGTSRVALTATDANGNTATQSYDVDVPVSTKGSSYDANGNLLTQGTRTYEWDAANQLVRVRDAGTEIARFVYDGYGRRAEKTTAGTTRRYVYAGSSILEEQSSSGTLRFVHGPRDVGSSSRRAVWRCRREVDAVVQPMHLTAKGGRYNAGVLPQPLASDTSDAAEAMQIERWRSMTPAEKAAIVSGLTRTVGLLAQAGIRRRFPSASEREQFLRFAIVMLGRDLALEVYPEIAALEPR